MMSQFRWTVFLDLDNSGVLKGTDPKVPTDSSGYCSFSRLKSGAYIVQVIRPSGWNQTTPANNFGQHVTLSTNQTVAGLIFVERS